MTQRESNATGQSTQPTAEEVIRGLVNAMEMQEGRESEAFHIPQHTAICIWNDAKDHAQRWLAKPQPEIATCSEERLKEALRPALERVFDHFDDMPMGRALQILVDSLRDLESIPSATERRWKRGDQRVVCAAIRDGLGRIVTGARHFDGVMMEQIRRTSPDQDAFRTAEQGFIDQFGKFLTREEARTLAEKQGQILDECGGNGIDLYSENLY